MAIRAGASNREGAMREVCTQLIPVKVNLEGRVMFPMQRMTEMQREIDELKRELRHAR